MTITVNTNMAAIRIQENLQSATDGMNDAMIRMSSGLKINSAGDNPAGFSVSTKLSNTISGLCVAQDNVSIGLDMLATAEGVLKVVQENLGRINDLVTQGANETYSADDLSALASEVAARFEEIETVTDNATFNGKALFSGAGAAVTIQSGTTAAEQTTIPATVFAEVADAANFDVLEAAIAAAFASADPSADLSAQLANLSTFVDNIIQRQTDIGANQSKLASVEDALEVMTTNLTSALSTIQDSDTAADSADYVQKQILQQISTSLLSSANQAASIAYTLVQGTQG